MAMFLKRYGSDLVVLAMCLGFGFYVLAQACRDNRLTPGRDAAPATLALAGR